MAIRVAPEEANPTHHFSLQDRYGTKLGLTVCKSDGDPRPFRDPSLFIVNPVTTTAFKQTSGQGGYDIFDHPYSPIVQDTWEGGRAALDFERDTTKFYDSKRAQTGRQNKVYAGPLEHYAEGAHRSLIQSMPGSVDYIALTGENRYIYKRFQATTLTTSKVWLKVGRESKPGDLTIKLYADAASVIDTELASLAVPYTWTDDSLAEWLNDTLAETLTNGAYYWLVVIGDASDTEKKHWKVAVKEAVGSTYTGSSFSTSPSAAAFDLYFRLTDADTEKQCIGFEYKEGQYFVVSGASGAPKLYMAGYRGAADSNAGQLDKLLDGSKSWATNELAGAVVLITDGPGKLEAQPWRTIVSNTGGAAIMDENWTVEHTTATEYVIFSPELKEIVNHGLLAPVTDVMISPQGVVYFCMGNGAAVRRFRAFNDGGTWRDFNDALCKANETFNADFMVYKPGVQRVVVGSNSTAITVNINTNATFPGWGTALTFGTATNADHQFRKINGMIVHPDENGNEVVWLFKTDMLFQVQGTTTISGVQAAGPDEIRAVRSIFNGVNPIKHDVYMYFPLLQGLEKYYGGTYTDMGPNLNEGLPANRRGPIVDLLSYPGKFYAAVDAGDEGYSSIFSSGGGWHELYRAPKGQRIRGMTFQVVPGDSSDRLWIYQGNDLVYLKFPSNSTNELEDELYEFVDECCVEDARKHAGLYDVLKMVRFLKLQTDNLEVDSNGRAVCWIEVDYKTDAETGWTRWETPFTVSPTQSADFGKNFGWAGKRLKLRYRLYTRDKSKTALLLASILSAVLIVDVKEMLGPFTVLCEDGETVGLRDRDESMSATEKMLKLKDWADASNDSMLLLNSTASICDGKMVFMNVGTRRQIRFKGQDGHTKDAYLVDVSFQDA